MGVPTLGCDCSVCTSTDPRDNRLRPSIMLRWQRDQHERVVLIDTGPDFREQALRNRLTRVDAVFYTHAHADHIMGLDDLRPLSFNVYREGQSIRLFASEETSVVLHRIFDYTLSPQATYPTRARVQLEPLSDRTTLFGVDFQRIPVLHGTMQIDGFRFGNTAYLTDVSAIPESSFELLKGLDTLILSALRHEPHPSHTTVQQAIEWATRIGARQTRFTHIAHELGHIVTNQLFPAGMELAYDGLSLPITL